LFVIVNILLSSQGQQKMTDKQPTQVEERSVTPSLAGTKPESTRCTYQETPDLQAPRSRRCRSERIAESDKEERSQPESEDWTDTEAFPPVNDIPDGGTEAWLVVLGAWCVSFCSYGWINSVGTFQEYYQTGPLKDYSASTISWIPSLQIFFMSVLGPIIGNIYDRYGMRVLLIVGSLMHVFGLMMASLSSQYYQFLLSQGVCSAIGVAIVFLSAISAVTGWFHKRRGLAFGILATGSSLGGVVFPIMLTRMINKVGYGWAMRTSAFIIMALLIVANLLLKTRQAPSRRALPRKHMWRPFRETPFVLLLIGLFLVPFGLYTPIDYLPVASIGQGMSKDMAQNLVAFFNAARYVRNLEV
jgi:MFS family permease